MTERELYSPAGVELHVRVKEAHDGSRGGVPAVDPGPDQALTLAVPHDLHQTRVALVHVLVQVELELHWKKKPGLDLRSGRGSKGRRGHTVKKGPSQQGAVFDLRLIKPATTGNYFEYWIKRQFFFFIPVVKRIFSSLVLLFRHTIVNFASMSL